MTGRGLIIHKKISILEKIKTLKYRTLGLTSGPPYVERMYRVLPYIIKRWEQTVETKGGNNRTSRQTEKNIRRNLDRISFCLIC